MARTSLFGSKHGGDRVQGDLTEEGARLFEVARDALQKLAKRHAGRDHGVSDGEVIEYLARFYVDGRDLTVRALKAG